MDAALAAVLAGFGVLDALTTEDFPSPRLAAAALVGLAGLSLALRRSRPVVSFVSCVAALTALSFTVGHFEAGSALLIMMIGAYSVGAHAPRARAALAATAVMSVVSGFGPGQPSSEMVGDFVFTLVLLLLPLSIGMSMRRQVRRAVLAERENVTLHFERAHFEAAAVDRERRRIARELHDIISHSLGIVVLHAGVAARVLESEPAMARNALDVIRSTGQEAIGEMGALVKLIRDEADEPKDPQPTLADVDRLVAATRMAGLDVRIERVGDVALVSAAIELNAYRVVQEALTNALKYAGESTVVVRLVFEPGGIGIEVIDDGRGGVDSLGGGHGLLGLRERVAVFGGALSAGRVANGGWTVRATFPTSR